MEGSKLRFELRIQKSIKTYDVYFYRWSPRFTLVKQQNNAGTYGGAHLNQKKS